MKRSGADKPSLPSWRHRTASATMHAATCRVRAPGAPARCHAPTPGSRFSVLKHRPRVATTETVALQAVDTATLVDKVLALTEDSDNGRALTDEQRTEVDALLDELEVRGRGQQPRPLEDPLIWGHYNVAYTSTQRSPDKGDPAGGRFRNSIGRTLFRTTGLYQSCLGPDTVTNKVAFRLFGLLDGYVGLRGKLEPVGETGDTVKVFFDPTVLSFGPLHLRLGSPSQVQLTTTYLDERVRLGKGSRGSLFVFTRGGAADNADMHLVGTERTSQEVAMIAIAGYVAAMLGALALVLAPGVPPLLKGLAACVGVLGGLVGAVLRNGGIIPEDQSYKNLQASQAGQQPEDNEPKVAPIVG